MNMNDFPPEFLSSMARQLGPEYPAFLAALTAGDTANSYQWQSSADGKTWTDLEGETRATLTLVNGEDYNGTQFRCVVKNEGVDISTTHGGVVKTYATTALDPIAISVEIEVKETHVALQNGDLELLLNGRNMGTFTFAQTSDGKWTIKNADGKYLAASGSSLSLNKKAFNWTFEDGVFSADTKVSVTSLGKLLNIGSKAATAYLTVSGGELAVSTTSGAHAAFLVQTETLVESGD